MDGDPEAATTPGWSSFSQRSTSSARVLSTIAIKAQTVYDSMIAKDGDFVTIEAKPLSPTHALKERTIRRVILCGLLVVILAMAGVVAFFVTREQYFFIV
jgi:hypothetical protein